MPHSATGLLTPLRRALALLAAACVLHAAALSPAQAQTADQLPPGAVPVETRPVPVPDPDASAKKPLPRSQRMQIKKTGEYVYKCGDEYTDNPVCNQTPRGKPLKQSVEDERRCDIFKRGNFVPWYCQK